MIQPEDKTVQLTETNTVTTFNLRIEKTELEEIKKELESTVEGFKDAYENYGYDLANERYHIETALKKVNILLLYIEKSELVTFLLMPIK